MKQFFIAFVAVAMLIGISSDAMAQSSKKGSSKKGSTSRGAATASAGLKVGDKAPDFTIGTFEDKNVVLSERFGDEGRPVVLLFSRANW